MDVPVEGSISRQFLDINAIEASLLAEHSFQIFCADIVLHYLRFDGSTHADNALSAWAHAHQVCWASTLEGDRLLRLLLHLHDHMLRRSATTTCINGGLLVLLQLLIEICTKDMMTVRGFFTVVLMDEHLVGCGDFGPLRSSGRDIQVRERSLLHSLACDG